MNYLHLIEEIGTFLNMLFKFPMRVVCKSKKEHNWFFYGGGFLFTAKYSFICKRCGCRSKGDIDNMEKKGFKGKAKIS